MWHSTLLFIFHAVLLTLMLHFIGIEGVIIYGFASMLTRFWEMDVKTNSGGMKR